MAQTLGIVAADWGGKRLDFEKGASVKLGGLKNNPVITGRRVDFAQEMEASEVKGTVPLRRGQRLSDIYAVGSGLLTIQCDTGHSFVFPDAFLMNRPEMTGGEGGKIELQWAAGDYEELVA